MLERSGKPGEEARLLLPWLPLICCHVQLSHIALYICADSHDVIAVRVYDVDVESKDEGVAAEVCP